MKTSAPARGTFAWTSDGWKPIDLPHVAVHPVTVEQIAWFGRDQSFDVPATPAYLLVCLDFVPYAGADYHRGVMAKRTDVKKADFSRNGVPYAVVEDPDECPWLATMDRWNAAFVTTDGRNLCAVDEMPVRGPRDVLLFWLRLDVWAGVPAAQVQSNPD